MLKNGTAYNLVAEALRTQILSGDLQPGIQLPTEQDLCQRFSTSRITIRRALQILEEERLIQRRQGSGTFVSPSPTRKIPLLNVGFFGSVTRHAPDLRRRLVTWSWQSAGAELAQQLETVSGDRVLYARRVDLLGEKTVAMDDVHLLGRAADRLGERELAELDFITIWQQVQGICLSYCKQTLEAVGAEATVARTLGLKAGAPVLKELDVTYLDSGGAAGVFVSYYRPDYFQFSGTVRFSSDSGGEVP